MTKPFQTTPVANDQRRDAAFAERIGRGLKSAADLMLRSGRAAPRTAAAPTAPSASPKATAEPPLIFQTVARLNLAHSSERGVTGGSSTRTISDTPGQPAAVPGSEGAY